MRSLAPKSLVLALFAVGLLTTAAPPARADDEKDRVEKIGASLCRAVRSMNGDPILKSYTISGNTLKMEVAWFGLITGNKYTSDITITYGTGGKIDKIKYDDTCIIPAYDLDYVEKWRREQNK